MNKLLAANFSRLFKNKVFWICCIFAFCYGVFMQTMNYLTSIASGEVPQIDDLFFSFAIWTGILLSAFISLFLGTEYSDGTIRNKLVIGHRRHDIYLSNLIVCITAGAVMCAINLVVSFAVGIPLMGGFAAGAELVFATCIGILITAAAFASICTMISMLCQNKAAAAVINILLIFLLLFVSLYIRAWLEAPETVTTQSVVMGENGVSSMTTEEVPNPVYLSGTARETCEFINDLLPTGQAVQFTNMEAENIPLLCSYSAVITAVAAGAGTILFTKKDIR